MHISRYQIPAARFTPFARLHAFQREVDRFFGTTPVPHPSPETQNPGFSPALDVYQDENHVFVTAELPGLKKENITLSLHDGLLTVAGERQSEKSQDERRRLRTERFFGRFERTVTLPVQVDGTRVAAAYEDGVLTVTLPKAEAAKPRQIDIAVK